MLKTRRTLESFKASATSVDQLGAIVGGTTAGCHTIIPAS